VSASAQEGAAKLAEILGKYIGTVGAKKFLAIRVILPIHMKSRRRWRGVPIHSRLLLVTNCGSFWAPPISVDGEIITTQPLMVGIPFVVHDILLVDYLNLEKIRLVDFEAPVHANMGETITFSYRVLTYDSLHGTASSKVRK
jgi:hypothetical protein